MAAPQNGGTTPVYHANKNKIKHDTSKNNKTFRDQRHCIHFMHGPNSIAKKINPSSLKNYII